MVTIEDVIKVLEDFAPLSAQEKWDNSGLCIGEPKTPLKGVLIGLDCTESLVDEAVAMGANLIVTHHPLLFSGLKKISPEDPVGAAVIKAVSNGVAVYCSHTPSDKVRGGVSFAMAEKLALEDVEILEPDGDSSSTGLGVVGNLHEPMEVGEFVASVKTAFRLPVLRCSAPIYGKVSRVAMCGGSGSEFIPDAIRKGAQAYLCGDISYHRFFCPKNFMLMDVGHYESEIGIVEIFFTIIKKNFPTFAVRITEKDSNPIFYF